MIAIIDYGAGNLFSVKNALDFLGLENKITNSAADLSAADRLILPGVGAFPDAMRMLGETGLIGVIKEGGTEKAAPRDLPRNADAVRKGLRIRRN